MSFHSHLSGANMGNNLSLTDHCTSCEAGCCYAQNHESSPILSRDEAEKIESMDAGYVQEAVSPNGGRYFIIKKTGDSQDGKIPCAFLEDDKCRVQAVKPRSE